ncbi:MAG: peptidoglycan-associated lipoprotein Pal [Mariprofundaceae bacterium]|nr:peptidoglycan-associated lipoprotein Pal [Mariprofundaceae bacterium]
MKLNKILWLACVGLGLMVSGCAAKKNDLSIIEAQKAQYNAEVRLDANSLYQSAQTTLNQDAGNTSTSANQQAVKNAMAELKQALAGNDIEKVKLAKQKLAAALQALKESDAAQAAADQAAAAQAAADQAAAAQAKLLAKPISNGVYFAFDSASLESAGNNLLEAYSTWLNANADVNVTIEGNCDQRGSREYNLALGQQRADSIKQYLVQRGVNESRLDAVSFGEERPVCQGSGEACWAQNRHADIVSR